MRCPKPWLPLLVRKPYIPEFGVPWIGSGMGFLPDCFFLGDIGSLRALPAGHVTAVQRPGFHGVLLRVGRLGRRA